jgi:hypothetical protein
MRKVFSTHRRSQRAATSPRRLEHRSAELLRRVLLNIGAVGLLAMSHMTFRARPTCTFDGTSCSSTSPIVYIWIIANGVADPQAGLPTIARTDDLCPRATSLSEAGARR